jgi:hypothetical protein
VPDRPVVASSGLAEVTMHDFARDIRQGVRLLRGSPGFTLVVLGTLGVTIAACVTAFSITDAWLFRPLRFPCRIGPICRR